MKRILDAFFSIQEIQIVEVQLDKEERFCGSIIVLKKVDSEFTFNTIGVWNSVEELKRKISKKLPILLLVHGSGVINRSFDYNSETEEQVLNDIVGTGQAEDFFLDIHNLDGYSIASIIRKEKMDSILPIFEDYSIVDISIGPNALSVLPDNILENETLYCYNYQIQKNNDIISIQDLDELSEEEYEINNQKIENRYLLGLSAGLQYLFYINDEIKTNLDIIDNSLKEIKYKKVFLKSAKVLSLLFFTFLLANFIYLKRLEKEYIQLDSIYQVNKSQLLEAKKLEKEYLAREELIKRSGWNGDYLVSTLADKLATLVPEKIQLKSLNINPIHGKMKSNYPIEFSNNKLIVSGFTPNSLLLNNWINDLQSLDKVKVVVLKDFEESDVKQMKNFIIEINLN